MRGLWKFSQAFLALLLLVGAAGGACYVVAALVHSAIGFVFKGVDPTVAAAMVAGLATVAVSVVGVFLGRYFERRKMLEAEIRVASIPMYTEFINGMLAMFRSADPADDDETAKRTADLVELLTRLTPDLVRWASDDVLVAWSRYRRRASSLSTKDSMQEFGELMKALRKDFGHRNRGVKVGDLLGLFVNDIDEYM